MGDRVSSQWVQDLNREIPGSPLLMPSTLSHKCSFHFDFSVDRAVWRLITGTEWPTEQTSGVQLAVCQLAEHIGVAGIVTVQLTTQTWSISLTTDPCSKFPTCQSMAASRKHYGTAKCRQPSPILAWEVYGCGFVWLSSQSCLSAASWTPQNKGHISADLLFSLNDKIGLLINNSTLYV